MTFDPQTPLDAQDHRDFLIADTNRQFDFFAASMNPAGGFYVLDAQGRPLASAVQELHTTTRLVHSYALGQIAGRAGSAEMVAHGLSYLQSHHRDRVHGGYLWALEGDDVADGRKLAYGHVFVLLAASSALAAGHPAAKALFEDIDQVLDAHFWQDAQGLFCDEWNRDWTPFSNYRGMNANMHGVEALLAAYEASGQTKFLDRAGRILEFFLGQMAPKENWRLPEHYTESWQVDRGYAGDPMFRPAGTTPGHSFELARLLLHYGALTQAPLPPLVATARQLTYRALSDAWDADQGGLFYTLEFGGAPSIKDRYWWPVTEAIGVIAALLKVDPQPEDVQWYQTLWRFAQGHFIDAEQGGWFPEIDAAGKPTARQFLGKPDIYHSVQATLFPLCPHVSGVYRDLRRLLAV